MNVQPEQNESSASKVYRSVISSSESSWSPSWYVGIVLAGSYFLLLSVLLIDLALRNQRMGLLTLSSLGLFAVCLVTGIGLIARQEWSRITGLFCVPLMIFLFINTMGALSEIYKVNMLFVWGLLMAGITLFGYLLLPQVKALFPKIAIMSRMQPRRLNNLQLPPRRIPLSLYLAVIFNGRRTIWKILIIFLAGMVLAQLKGISHGHEWQYVILPDVMKTPAGIMASFLAFVFVAYIIYGLLIKQDIYFLENGILTYGVLCSKSDIREGKREFTRLSFNYEVGGATYTTSVDVSILSCTKRIEDEPKEPILYDPREPQNAMLLDCLPSQITVDDEGNLALVSASMGYLYAGISLALAAVIVLITVR
jgi:hypothetical protein